MVNGVTLRQELPIRVVGGVEANRVKPTVPPQFDIAGDTTLPVFVVVVVVVRGQLLRDIVSTQTVEHIVVVVASGSIVVLKSVDAS
jgi:hypothetical protein